MELSFEYLLAGLEPTRGTALTIPTHYLPLAGTVTPRKQRYRPAETDGTLAEFRRSVDVRRWCDWEAEGALDVYVLPLLLNTLARGGVSAPGTPPPDAILTELWEFEPTMTADDLEALTLFWGDPNVQAFRAAFCMPDELAISADASGTDGVTMRLGGQGHFPTKTAPGSVPARLNAPLLMPSAMQLWVDSGVSPIGTTEVTGRLASAEVTLPLGGARKWLAAGPAGGLNFQALGRAKRHLDLKLTLEVPDLTEYDLWVAETVLKARIRFNGPAIETVGSPSVTYYHYVEFDVYGPFDGMDWGELEGTNRTIQLTTLSEYDNTAGYDWCTRVQSDRGTL